ncbi:DNA protecting protein DprA [Vibrio sp. MACH09]|uniref:DNA-processing protein DprA n=1 Tax=Vibrio sp. MACH09 TaxID=3025122 RepID=UPI00278F63B5|nr:DNA-processing protein DprA [Vibrio sp. MACH09]GLO62369.1 DNA protecting protein DprA [Vibrio sp. MACH09]
MKEKQLLSWLMLSATPNIGGYKLTKLLYLDSAENIVGYSTARLQSIGFNSKQVHYIKHQARSDAELCLKWRDASCCNHIITLNCELYPSLLKEIASPPPVLFIKGDPKLLSRPQIAIVGSRNASIDGLNLAKRFSASLVEQKLIITSGLALGIDGYAHDGALSAKGKTIAVLGSGLDNIYPSRHKSLASRIIDSGALVSEFRPNAKPRAEHFPRRNRIISGLSCGVLVVEAALKSGSLITARYALEQNRDVFALPGTIQSPHSLGSNKLIQQGAKLVQNCEDILVEIESLLNWSIDKQLELFDQQDENEQLPFHQLLANVGVEATPVDILAQRTNIPVSKVMMQLLELELQGHVAAVTGGYIRMRRG